MLLGVGIARSVQLRITGWAASYPMGNGNDILGDKAAGLCISVHGIVLN
jgi:hypothetical protein